MRRRSDSASTLPGQRNPWEAGVRCCWIGARGFQAAKNAAKATRAIKPTRQG